MYEQWRKNNVIVSEQLDEDHGVGAVLTILLKMLQRVSGKKKGFTLQSAFKISIEHMPIDAPRQSRFKNGGKVVLLDDGGACIAFLQWEVQGHAEEF